LHSRSIKEPQIGLKLAKKFGALLNAMSNEVSLDDAPVDCISRVRFFPGRVLFGYCLRFFKKQKGGKHSNLLLASSWDQGVRLYDCDSNRLVNEHKHSG
jgi:hypothetical protein